MMEAIKNYLSYAGIQYRHPDKAGDEREKMLALRHKGQEARKSFTDQSVDEPSAALTTTFLGLFAERGKGIRTYDSSALIWDPF